MPDKLKWELFHRTSPGLPKSVKATIGHQRGHRRQWVKSQEPSCDKGTREEASGDPGLGWRWVGRGVRVWEYCTISASFL
jgi:hypothetical protein